MYLKQLKLSSVRNLKPASLEFSPHFNWIFGKNGSGKTSLLEAIYLLSTGRSFRSRHAFDFIQHETDACVASGLIFSQKSAQTLRLGVERHLSQGLRLRRNEESFEVLSEWVKFLPVQLINIDSYQLLSISPALRRQFLDWPMFHVEHSFYSLLQRYRRALKQRNAAIKAYIKAPKSVKRDKSLEIELWNKELSETGEAITHKRRHFLNHFFQKFNEHLGFYLTVEDLQLEFQQGWNENYSLAEALTRTMERDFVLGYTSAGPHRADFGFLLRGKIPIESVLSRGQLKMFITALFLARAAFVSNVTERAPLCLLDDLSAELDENAIDRLLKGLLGLNAQVFVTSIENNVFGEDFLKKVGMQEQNIRMFHVEQGQVRDMIETVNG